jgi:hypothetical protein
MTLLDAQMHCHFPYSCGAVLDLGAAIDTIERLLGEDLGSH